MNDDFNSPLLIAQLFDAVKFINAVSAQTAKVSAEDRKQLEQKMHQFIHEVLGLQTIQEGASGSSEALDGTVKLLIDIRKEARDNKDFATSDKIRDQLLKLGIQLKDGKDGTSFTL